MNGLGMMVMMVACCAGVLVLFVLGPFIGWLLTIAIVGVAMIAAMGLHFWLMRDRGSPGARGEL